MRGLSSWLTSATMLVGLLIICVSAAPAEGSVALSWELSPPSLAAKAEQFQATASANYDPNMAAGKEWEYSSSSITFVWEFKPDGAGTTSQQGQPTSDGTLAMKSTATIHYDAASAAANDKTVRVRAHVTGSILDYGPDGEKDTDDDVTIPIDAWSDWVSANLTVVKVGKLQYKIGAGQYTDVTGTLYMAKGTTVDFKAIRVPAGDAWPGDKPTWSGSSGASGSGATKSVTFNTLSSSASDYKTVIATCGSSTVTASVIVFEVNIKASDGQSDPPGYAGLGGTLQLKAIPSPSLSGTYTWSETSPKISLTNPNSQTVTVNGEQTSSSAGDAQVKVDFDPTGLGNTDDDTHNLTVVEVDLGIAHGGSDLDNGEVDNDPPSDPVLSEAEEENPGAYLLVNWDNDDETNPPVPDLSKDSVNDEDNLGKLTLSINPSLNVGTLELVKESGSSSIKIWTTHEKGTEVTDLTWDLSQETAPTELWIEGRSPSGQMGVVLKLRYKDPSNALVHHDTVKATVVMIRLGNAVYREAKLIGLKERCHAGLVYSFDGPVKKENIINHEKYGICQMKGLNPADDKLDGITNADDLEYWYCYTNTSAIQDNVDGYEKRLKILKVASWALHDWDSNYCAWDCMDPKGPDWDGTLDDVGELRCDGLVELAYEYNGIMAWGKKVGGTVHYDMRNNDYLAEHNDWVWGDDPEDWDDDMWGSFLPVTQGGFADDYIEEHYPDYQDPAFRGNLWDTTFQEQRLVSPNVLSPESHNH